VSGRCRTRLSPLEEIRVLEVGDSVRCFAERRWRTSARTHHDGGAAGRAPAARLGWR